MISNNNFKSNDKINNYLINKAKCRKEDYGIFYHYIKYEHIFDIIKCNKIRLYSLSSQWKNDPFEQTEFLRRFASYNNKDINKYEEYKNKSFIFCFTNSYTTERMWQEYASNKENKQDGIVIGFRFRKFNNKTPYSNMYSLKNVVYETNNDFDFINEIQFNIKKILDKSLINLGLEAFAKYYKRSKFSWENETRLVFDLNDYYKLKEYSYIKPKVELSEIFNINTDDNREYITLDLFNQFFNLQIDEIICGKDVSTEDFNKLKSSVNDNVIVWKRK